MDAEIIGFVLVVAGAVLLGFTLLVLSKRQVEQEEIEEKTDHPRPTAGDHD